MSGGKAQVEAIRSLAAPDQDIRCGTRAAIPDVTS
jgi:hypothetical protein